LAYFADRAATTPGTWQAFRDLCCASHDHHALAVFQVHGDARLGSNIARVIDASLARPRPTSMFSSSARPILTTWTKWSSRHSGRLHRPVNIRRVRPETWNVTSPADPFLQSVKTRPLVSIGRDAA
jgi:hypothetical protein